ncbi:hypothetical protein SAMN05216276_1009205 [Streptosporangium subroseum]|uniref:Uncharacterized protein n=1 Tax=Streptosporangium subroseum TaxID=106412 RepID=A0A239EMZ2_9ACTN|nr:hypothetical protein SAMN05216276_1009205 [Streptosporangium subroseum]
MSAEALALAPTDLLVGGEWRVWASIAPKIASDTPR